MSVALSRDQFVTATRFTSPGHVRHFGVYRSFFRDRKSEGNTPLCAKDHCRAAQPTCFKLSRHQIFSICCLSWSEFAAFNAPAQSGSGLAAPPARSGLFSGAFCDTTIVATLPTMRAKLAAAAVLSLIQVIIFIVPFTKVEVEVVRAAPLAIALEEPPSQPQPQ